MMLALDRCGLRVVSLSACFWGGVWGVKYCWNRCSSILAFETSSKFFFRVAFQQIITHFQNCALLKVSLATLIMVVMKTEMRIFNNIKIKGNEELILVILNFTSLHGV